MKTSLLSNETVVMDSSANLQRGAESVGGRLFLTSQRLIFEPHSLNIQRGVATVPLGDIRQAAPCWTKLFNLLPVAPNSLDVETRAGKHLRLVLWKRRWWRRAIDRQREKVAT